MTERDADPEVDDDVDGPCKCWCGAEGAYEDLFDDDFLDDECGGTGVLHCYCGGDMCVCHNHGESPCPGCEDCEADEDDYRDDGDYGGCE